jgi:hypothetical protein
MRPDIHCTFSRFIVRVINTVLKFAFGLLWKINPTLRVKEGFVVNILVIVIQLHQLISDW